MRELNQESGTAFLVVTHDGELAAKMDKQLHMQDGLLLDVEESSVFSSLSLLIGSRFSRAKQRNKMVSFISLSSTIGITVGVAVIIIGLSAMNGFERELKDRVLSVIAHGEFEGVRGPIFDWQSVMDQAEKHPKIEAAAPYVTITALAEKGNKVKALKVRGVDAELESKVSSISRYVGGKAWQNFMPGKQQVILGQGVAGYLGVSEGDYLTLMIPTAGLNYSSTSTKAGSSEGRWLAKAQWAD